MPNMTWGNGGPVRSRYSPYSRTKGWTIPELTKTGMSTQGGSQPPVDRFPRPKQEIEQPKLYGPNFGDVRDKTQSPINWGTPPMTPNSPPVTPTKDDTSLYGFSQIPEVNRLRAGAATVIFNNLFDNTDNYDYMEKVKRIYEDELNRVGRDPASMDVNRLFSQFTDFINQHGGMSNQDPYTLKLWRDLDQLRFADGPTLLNGLLKRPESPY
jgi:hypothetical protein